MKGESDQMPVDLAVAMIHATPPEDRSHFAKEIWRLRRGHGRAEESSDGDMRGLLQKAFCGSFDYSFRFWMQMGEFQPHSHQIQTMTHHTNCPVEL
jgi:hypothetical protein